MSALTTNVEYNTLNFIQNIQKREGNKRNMNRKAKSLIIII